MPSRTCYWEHLERGGAWFWQLWFVSYAILLEHSSLLLLITYTVHPHITKQTNLISKISNLLLASLLCCRKVVFALVGNIISFFSQVLGHFCWVHIIINISINKVDCFLEATFSFSLQFLELNITAIII